MKFHTAAEVGATAPEQVPWIARPWVAQGCITELDGKVKAAGKTTFLAAMVSAVLDGRPFLGEPTTKMSVVWLTEQTKTSFREVLRRAGLLNAEDLAILFWNETRDTRWEEVAAGVLAEAERRYAGLLIVDTLGQFAGLRGDTENSSGDALAAVQPLQAAAAAGLGVVIARHERKGGGEVGESGRGSSAFAGAVDIILALRRPAGNQRSTVRQVSALSRFDETPPELMLELTDCGYVALGGAPDVARQEAFSAIMAEAPCSETQAIPLAAILEGLPNVKRTLAQKVVGDLVKAGTLKVVGVGKKGDPRRYWRPDSQEKSLHPGDDSLRRKPIPIDGRANCDDGGLPGVHAGDEAGIHPAGPPWHPAEAISERSGTGVANSSPALAGGAGDDRAG